MKLNKLFFAALSVAAIAFSACDPIPEDPDGPGQGGKDTTQVNPPAGSHTIEGLQKVTVAEALAICEALDTAKSTPVCYVCEAVVSVVNTNAADVPAKYDNVNFKIKDATGEISCQYTYYLDSVGFTSADQMPAVGDTVIVSGKLKKYLNKNTNVCYNQFTNAYIYSISRKGQSTGPTPTTIEHAGTLEDPYTASDAYVKAGEFAQGTHSDTIYIKGTVKSIDDIDVGSYGNATFYITDGAWDFYCFRIKGLNNSKFISVQQLKVGDEVTIKTVLTTYNGTRETNYGYLVATTNTYDGGADSKPTYTLPAGESYELDFSSNPFNLTEPLTIKAQQTYTVGDYTLIIDGSANTSSGAQVSMDLYKMYKNTTFTLTAPQGKTIKYILFIHSGANYSAVNLTTTNGTIAADTNNEGLYSWSGSANAVTCSNTAQVRISKMIIVSE